MGRTFNKTPLSLWSFYTLEKWWKAGKPNYIPINILSNVSKIYEKCFYSPLYDHFDKNIISKE